jgi:hypothetical protein
MNEVQKQVELNIDLFNVSSEFEDIAIVIDNTTGEAVFEAASRRC